MQDAKSGKDRIKIIVAVAIFIAAAGFAWYQFGGESDYDRSVIRGYLCNECQTPFDHTPKEGDIEPLKCPNCKAMAGYQAELCYWTKGPDGQWKAKLKPTYVILKQRIDHTSREQTFCPDCGHEVVGHNPKPSDDEMAAAEAEAGKR